MGPSPLDWLPIAALMKDDGWRRGLLEGAGGSEAGMRAKYGSHLERARELSTAAALGDPAAVPLFLASGQASVIFRGRNGNFRDPVYAWLVRVIISCSQQR